MGTPAVTASGERSVAVGGNVYGPIVTGDNVRVVIRDGGVVGTLLDGLGLRRRVRTKARPTPLDLRPPPFSDFIGREQEAAALLGAHSDRPLNVVGEALVGKTYLLRAALDRLDDAPARHGVVVLYGGSRGLDDLLQALWEACYQSRPPSVPTRAQAERDLADREMLVVVDSAELEHDDAQALAAALPRSRLVLVSRERRWHDGDELAVLGLGEDDALALLERELGAPLSGSERDAGVAACRALGGHPARVRRAGVLVRSGAATLAGLAGDLAGPDPARASAATAVAFASDDERDVLAALAPFEGEPIGAGLLNAIAGPGSAERAGALADRLLLVTGSPRYALPVDIAKGLDDAQIDRAETRAVDRLTTIAEESPDELADDLPAVLSLLDRLSRRGRHTDVVKLGRAIAPLLVRARRLGSWATAAAAVRTAAHAVDDHDAEAWAIHELGTHAVARDDVHGGRELLEDALERRARLGDTAGVAATRQNLRALQPPWYLAHVLQLPPIALIVAVVLIGAGGVGAAWLVTRDDDDVTVSTGTETGETDENGPTTDTTTDGPTEPDDVLLKVEPTGGATGTVTSEPAGITCPGACEMPFAGGTELVLSAEADEGAVLADWGHERCADPSRSCLLELVEPTTVAPRFERAVSLTVGVSGSGSVAIEPSGTDCADTCTETLAQGTEVTLTATERDGSAFMSWSGSLCEPVKTCSLVLDSSTKVAAAFAGPHSVTVTVEGPAGNRVTSSPAGIDCPGVCTAAFRHGTSVTLTPVESGDGSFFLGWTDDCTGNSGSCTLTLEEPASVGASFNPPVD